MTPEQLRAECARLAEIQERCPGPGYTQSDLYTEAERAYAVAAQVPALLDENEALRAELETERMRLAACGVVAMSDTPETAERNRKMHSEYWSASCGDVARRVDECMALRQRIAELERDAGRYRWLRACTDLALWDRLKNTYPFATGAFDAAIDAAMQAQTKEGGK